MSGRRGDAMILYTDMDPSCCAVLRARIADGSLPPGDVLCADVRSLDDPTLARYRHVHLFAGIGGAALGMAWADWPEEWSTVTGGFPCQDISSAGRGAGLDGERSGLFWEMMRVIEICKPDVVLAENVGALSSRGLDRVAIALGAAGYDCGAFRLGAWAVGSPQVRERWWILAGAMREHARDAQAGGCGAARRLVAKPDHQSKVRNANGGGRNGRTRDTERRESTRGSVQRAGPQGAFSDAARVGCGDNERSEPAVGAVAGEPDSRLPLGHMQCPRHSSWRRVAGPAARATGGGQCAAEPGRWPEWRRTDAEGRTICTPQHEWEPPRLYADTQVPSARWRLALMGYPLHRLDISDDELARLCKHKTHEKRRAWWNKEGVRMTGNAQVPQCVAAVMGGLKDAKENA